jgi:hypothetical protein
MYSIISFMLGVVLKLTDDIIDLDINTSNLTLELLKGLVIALHTYIGYGDFAYNLVIVTLLTASYFFKGIDCAYWQAIWIISIILCILSIAPLQSVWVIGLIALIATICIGIEAVIFTEETSIRKILWSVLFGSVLLIIMKLPMFTNFIGSLAENPISIYKLIYFGSGYFIARGATKTFILMDPSIIDNENTDQSKSIEIA